MSMFRGQIALLDRVFEVCERPATGLLARIDENRELLETLRDAPELLERWGRIEELISRNDDFFNDLMQAIGLENIRRRSPVYPRSWPGRFK